jgi:hypothetical protein
MTMIGYAKVSTVDQGLESNRTQSSGVRYGAIKVHDHVIMDVIDTVLQQHGHAPTETRSAPSLSNGIKTQCYTATML